MKSQRHTGLRLLWLGLLIGSSDSIVADEVLSSVAKAYLDTALNMMEEHSLYRSKIDWSKLRKETLFQAARAQTAIDTYPAIRFALARLGDHHSFLQLTPDLARQEKERQANLADPSAMPPPEVRKPSFSFPSPFRARREPEGAMVVAAAKPLAHLVVPFFYSEDPAAINGYATKVQAVINVLGANKPCGWIVDLRGNGGGNMWAMLAGVGPIIGDGQLGSTLDESGTKRMWFYENGRSGYRGDTKDPYYATTIRSPVVLTQQPSVAVLIDRDTGSSAEGIAIALRGRIETRFFGEQSYGAATSTSPFQLSDGAKIFVVTGAMLDREGNQYPLGVAPDQEIISAVTISSNDPVIAGASSWLSKTKSCKAAQPFGGSHPRK